MELSFQGMCKTVDDLIKIVGGLRRTSFHQSCITIYSIIVGFVMKISYDNIIYVRKDLKYWQSESENVGFNMELFSKIERGGKGIMPTQVPVFIMLLLWHINTELYWFTSCLLSRFQWLIVQMHISGKYIKWRRLDRQRNRQKYINLRGA